MRIVRDRIPRSEIAALAAQGFGDMVKAVVDVERRVMVLGGERHSDEAAMLLDDGSSQADLWGINLYPAEGGDDWIEFDCMINVRRGRETVRAAWTTRTNARPSGAFSRR